MGIYLILIISFIATYLSIPVIIHIAEKKNLVDVPDFRKVHAVPVAALGGIGIFGGFALTALLYIPFSKAPELQFIMAAALVILFLGMKDDILVLSPFKKFLGQLLAALLVAWKGNLQLTNLQGILGFFQIPPLAGLLLTVLVMVFIINAFNLIDGVDGLAGSLGLGASVILGYFFLKNGHYAYAALAFGLSGSILGFLFFNLHPARIFMGDTGSLLIGLVCSVLVVKFIETAPGSKAFPSPVSAAAGFSILLVPVLDTLRVFILRLAHKRSPFYPDKNHVHHILLSKGLNHNQITALLVSVNIPVVFFTYAAEALGSAWLMALLAGFYFLLIKLFQLLPGKQAMEKRTRKSNNILTHPSV
ncbi:MraY family glycosyltransferase [Paraflavisolibacter sp. H34]|uniref:MraY family glycosyltransferase n=1 Tax=Huijunlia imazamoxiresistens TaxID=3127457 RepID=UPI0030176D90